MKYEKEILDAFKYLNKSPRPNQAEYVNKVVEAFVDRRKRYVVLNAPTGTGKSIIGAVIADVINRVCKDPKNANGENNGDRASLILMHNNALTKQYHDTFATFGDQMFLLLKGANNYPCNALTDQESGEIITAEHCAVQKLKKEGLMEIVEQNCGKCQYSRNKKLKNVSKNVITNFSYYFVDRQYSDVFLPRDIVIWDEAHTVNDAFCEHNAIYFSKERLKKTYEELVDSLKLMDMETFKTLRSIQEDVENGKINETNYMGYLSSLMNVYKRAHHEAQALADNSGHDLNKYSKYSKLAKKYFGLGCKIDDLMIYNYEHIFEFNPNTLEATVKPIFIGSMFEQTLVHSRFNLFMSATISKEYLTETLQLKDEDIEFIQVPPTFPKEHKLLIFFDTQNLNYRSMQDEKVLSRLDKNVKDIVNKHVTEYEENGVILVPSFAIAQRMAEIIRKSGVKVKIFEHTRGMKADFIIQQFKQSEGPSILISPSIYEGVDLPGDLSRYQIIVKAPFPSLAEKRMKYILDHHQKIYNLLTIQKIVQGGGRSVRSEDDYAVTYILDSNAQRLFNSPLNVWKNEFSVLSGDVL